MAIWTEDIKEMPSGKQQVSFGMDSLADVPNLPPLSPKVCVGSDAFAIAEKAVVFLGSDGVWK